MVFNSGWLSGGAVGTPEFYCDIYAFGNGCCDGTRKVDQDDGFMTRITMHLRDREFLVVQSAWDTLISMAMRGFSDWSAGKYSSRECEGCISMASRPQSQSKSSLDSRNCQW